MTITRRQLLGAGGAASAAGLLGSLALPGSAAANDYRALVVLFLNGGNDGHNMLVPTDAAYGDYQTSRANLALQKNSLVGLQGSAAGHTFGMHTALAPLAPLYNNRRLAFIANAGPLIEPSTPAQVLSASVDLPPFLMSHSDQVAIQQGWTVADDTSGWAGRALELLPSALRTPLAAVTLSNNRTLVLGKRSSVSFLSNDGSRYWGTADLSQPQSEAAQSINRMAQWQFANAYEAEYARTFGAAVADSTLFTKAMLRAVQPSADLGSGYLADRFRQLASLLPVFKSDGLKRQVFLVDWGGFDTHANQRGNGPNTQDAQLLEVGKAVAGFDAAMLAAGMSENVTLLMMSDFGRTLRPGSGGGSEHAWGNHWFISGGIVKGGTVHGQFPDLQLGGPSDGDPNKNGRLVPSTSSDQIGATLMQWLGLPSNLFVEVFPNLVNFDQKTVPLLHA